MLIEWLEPSLEKSVDIVIESCIKSDEYTELNEKFMAVINELNSNFNLGSKVPELEDLLWSATVLSVNYAYRTSFADFMRLCSLNKS